MRGASRLRSLPAVVPAVAAAAGLAIGAWLTIAPGSFDTDTATRLDRVRAASAQVPEEVVALDARVDRPAALRSANPGVVGAPEAPAAKAAVLVPSPTRSRIALELDLPLTAVADSLAAFLAGPPASVVVPGQIVLHDEQADPGTTAEHLLYLPFEGDATLGKLRLEPILTDPERGIWIVRARAK